MVWENDGELFTSQACVDQYFELTKELANNVDTEEGAVELLKRIKYLECVSNEFFVSEDIHGWEEMALSYIESPDMLFQNVHYDILLENYQEFFEATRDLEQAVIDGLLHEDYLFSLVNDFNINLIQTNVNCERYDMGKFAEYQFENGDLGKKYNAWLKN